MKNYWRRYQIYLISFIGALLLTIGFSTPSQAHWADLAVAEITVEPTKTGIILTFPTGLVADSDDNRDGKLSTNEVTSHQTKLEKFLGDRIRLIDNQGEAGKIAVTPTNNLPANIQSNTNTHTTLELTYTWSQPVSALTINYDLFLPNVPTARCLATVIQGGKTHNLVFTPEQQEFALIDASIWQQIGSFILLGIEHIITGYDHVLFLISLLMLGGGWRYLLKVVTAFTISHSVTLSLAVLNIVSLPVRFVESAIALTIVYVAAENFWRKDVRGRWLLTFIFGLIHGLGFAGVLKEIHLSQSNLAVSLASFNIGVELGQIAIVSLAFLVLRTIQKYPWELNLRRLLSGCVVAMGLFWFIQRAFY
ncbi:HupE/UreJ family protein [Calothrix sp. FACHB-1219]|uniref:HupE/UreJ family protein n=1 Tax=unclassified Calothrix TaxID=2619626 RepID=UPI0016841080|nr:MULTISPECIES: HupE/UreJ family protein [unclassified Calothrix]MBD2204631.1 HupE/UreJ family protein [Calothrix sp. FACHB-168]MBD2216857.1 HupE/UreJ family protein [Calothrix sp. FACHB-1219]